MSTKVPAPRTAETAAAIRTTAARAVPRRIIEQCNIEISSKIPGHSLAHTRIFTRAALSSRAASPRHQYTRHRPDR
jgi:hypothetical protein